MVRWSGLRLFTFARKVLRRELGSPHEARQEPVFADRSGKAQRKGRTKPLTTAFFGAGGGTRTRDLLITNQLLWPSELRQHARNIGSRRREISGSSETNTHRHVPSGVRVEDRSHGSNR